MKQALAGLRSEVLAHGREPGRGVLRSSHPTPMPTADSDADSDPDSDG